MTMNKNERPSFLKGRGAAVGIVICFVAVIALVGVYTFNNYQKDIDEQMAKAEEQAEKLTEDKTEETTADDITLPEAEDRAQDGDGMTGDGGTALTDEESGQQDTAAAEGENAGGAETSGADTSGVWFSEDSVLTWPASGAVILGYSMDQTVFFQTLEQYKYNPAMIIGGEVGETITASAAGIVTNIEETAQTDNRQPGHGERLYGCVRPAYRCPSLSGGLCRCGRNARRPERADQVLQYRGTEPVL